MQNPIIVALDVPAAEAALKLVEQLAPVSGGFKIGSELFTSAGPDIVRRIHDTGAAVFLDLKFHDIPHTVAKAVESAAALRAFMLTVHASGGAEMLKAAGVRNKVKIMIGGAPVTQKYADEIGADGYSNNANAAVALARKLVAA